MASLSGHIKQIVRYICVNLFSELSDRASDLRIANSGISELHISSKKEFLPRYSKRVTRLWSLIAP